MKLFVQFVLSMLLSCNDPCCSERTGCDQTNEGNEFFVGFFRNRFGRTDEPEVIPPVLWITTKESMPVNFEVFTFFGLLTSGVATPREITYIDIPLGFVVFDSSEDSETDTRFKGIRIKAEDDRRIIVFGQNEEVASNDAYLALPIISLPAGRSYEYIAASIFGDSGTNLQAKDSVALIIGTENDTEIILEPSVLIRHPLAPAQAGRSFIPGIPVQFRTVTIQRFQTFYLQVRGGDISGTRIIANKPISVFSGHECAYVPLASDPCDILIEQLQPIDTWGAEVATVPLRTRSGDVLKVFASQDSTTVNVTYTDISSGMVTSDSFSFTLNRNGFRELGGTSMVPTGAIGDFALIQSNNPIAVFQFSRSFSTDNNIISDPFMLSVPYFEQYRNMYGVAPAPFNETIEGTVPGRVAYVNYTNIAVPAEYFNASLITVNDNPVNASEFRPIKRADNSIWGYGAQLLLDEGAQVIRHQDPNAALSVTIYGFSNQMSWGSIGGTGLAPIALCIIVMFNQSMYSVIENVGSAQPVLVLSNPSSMDVKVTVFNTDGTATGGGVDYTSGPYTVTFPAGVTSVLFDIPINNDMILEGNENVMLTIDPSSLPTGVTVGDPGQVIVAIVDDDPITVMFNQSIYSVDECKAQPVVVLSNPSSMDFNVTVFNTDGSATGGSAIGESGIGEHCSITGEGVDYIPGLYIVMFRAGETMVPFDITINDDDVLEGNETFMLTIDPSSLPTGVTQSDPGQATVTIVDNDSITVMFNDTMYSVNENAGPARPVLVLSNPSSMAFNVQVINEDITATGRSTLGGGVDYIAGPYTVTFPAGVTSVAFDIPINDDDILEGLEYFMPNIHPFLLPTGVTVGNPGRATVTIVDNDDVPPDIDEGPFIPQPPTVMPGDMTVTIGTPTYIVDGFDVTLVCNIASGTRPITIMWIRNGASYPAGGNQSIITVPDTDYNDGDVFTCRADNTIGFDMESTTINVFEPPQILPIPFPTPPPGEITVSTGQPMNTTIITLGTDVTIYCPSSGIDTPSIEWFRNGVMVVAGGQFTISTTTLPGAVITSVLRIDDFQGSDAGTYTCTATNVVGSDDGGTTLLGATAPPVIVEGQCIPQPEVILNNDVTVMIGSPAYIADGYDLTITCNIINGIPPINISWYRNGVVDSSRGSTSTITISSVDINKDNGVVYTCRVENDNGYDEQLTSVNVFTPLCSHGICRSRRNILCIIPDSMCLCKPQMGYCSAAYYSTETRPLPKACKRCRIPTDLDCIKMWSQCVKKQDEDAHGRPTRRMRTTTNFKIYMHPC